MKTHLLAFATVVFAQTAFAQVNDDAKAVLIESAKAIKDVTGLEFQTRTYATGMLKDIIDLSGTVKIWRPEPGAPLMWRVDGRAKDPGKPDRQLHVVSDGTTVTYLNSQNNTRVSAPASDPEAMEQANMCRELVLAAFTSATPFTMETTQFPNLTKTGLATVNGEVCEVIEATPEPKTRNRTWSISAKDHLPRSLELGTGEVGKAGPDRKISKITEMTEMKPAKFTTADFEIALPFGYEARVVTATPAASADTHKQPPSIPAATPTHPSANPAANVVVVPIPAPFPLTATPNSPLGAAPTSAPEHAMLKADRIEVQFQPALDPSFHDPTNAALLYYRAFMLLPDDVGKMVSDAVNPDNPSWLPSAELSEKLITFQDVSYTTMRAAKIDACEFGVEYSQGIGALLPHLGKMRAVSRFLAADARRLIQAQKPDEAADRIAAMFAMSRHLTGERLLISALVSNAIHSLACAQTEYLINSGQLTTAGKATIAAAMDKFNVPDPFGIRAAVAGERYWVVVWIRAKVAGPDGPRAFTEQILPLLDDKPDSEDAKAIKAMDAAQINADLDKSERYYSSVLEVFDLPDAEARLGALEKGIKDGEYGLIARHAAPAMGRAHQQYIKAQTRQNETRAHLDNAYARPS